MPANLLLKILGAIAGWLLVAPLAALVPKRRNWVAVIGRGEGRFLDNAKYFLLSAAQEAHDLRLAFVTERHDVVELLRKGHPTALRYPGWHAIWFLARCSTVVVDEAAWHRKLRAFLLIRAHVVQLWHGVGCKWIEAGLWAHEAGDGAWASYRFALCLRLAIYHFTRRRIRYAAVAVTSRFYRDNVFASAFAAHFFPLTGYPRNDFAQSLYGEGRKLAWCNVDEVVKFRLGEWIEAGRKLVLVAPTFRESGASPMQLNDATLRIADDFAEEHSVEFIFKFHPFERNAHHITGRHLHVCACDSDIYPILPFMAALVTDYSSISMDFLLIDKPLLFLLPANGDYVRNDRQLQFDPRTMMPGPVVADWPPLLTALLYEWSEDHHASQRADLRCKAFDGLPQSEAVSKLLALMRERGWVQAMPYTHTRGTESDAGQVPK